MILLNRLLTEATGKASYLFSSGIIPRLLYSTEAARKNRGRVAILTLCAVAIKQVPVSLTRQVTFGKNAGIVALQRFTLPLRGLMKGTIDESDYGEFSRY